MTHPTVTSSAPLGQHLRSLREGCDMTLDALARATGLSRATLSRIEKNEVSPTAETLGRLASAYALPISQLLSPMEQAFQPVIRRSEQAVWTDPGHAFTRRSVSPPSGQLSVELIEATLGEDQTITYAAPAVPGQEHHLYVLSGEIEITVEGRTHPLRQGDCLRYVLFGETVFRTAASPCSYVIALS
ncbi:XRE family transcriptional regulator [Aliishimia ponticola]|uniref:XRE family transcriptional regulator n=1 Tax=Aliishimia ponticola TaxID=2499833 RepID=A0A4S4NRR8_9RHOB|nr:XRE family transcriptional regulator [Aliishimia ponticola]THH38920.1 XRE family transcriptional regulator [Aliishimia ponticola]